MRPPRREPGNDEPDDDWHPRARRGPTMHAWPAPVAEADSDAASEDDETVSPVLLAAAAGWFLFWTLATYLFLGLIGGALSLGLAAEGAGRAGIPWASPGFGFVAVVIGAAATWPYVTGRAS